MPHFTVISCILPQQGKKRNEKLTLISESGIVEKEI
jgi:hypothetical protein